MSVQLEALADEVFSTAAAQGRAAGQCVRQPFGEIVWNPSYPDLFFLNGIVDLIAPSWTATDLERVLREANPQATSFRATSRNPRTIVALNPRLIAAGYSSETRVAMVQVVTPDRGDQIPSPSGGGQGRRFTFHPVQDETRWSAFEALIRADTLEHGWRASMTAQLIAFHRWRAVHTPQRFYVADDGDRAVAHVGLFQHGSTAYLHALFTHPAERRRGAGAALTLAMSEVSRAMGCARLTLQCTRDSHLPAFYERLGYRVVGEQQIWTKPA